MSSFKKYFYQNLGERVRYFREKRGLTQERLSEIVDRGPKYIGHIERHERNISTKILIKLIEFFEVQPEDFFNFEEKYKF